MPIEFSEDLFQNDDFKVETDNNGDLVQTHKQTGAEFKFDASKNRWVPVQGLDLGGATIDNVGSIDSDSIDVNSLSATQLSQALDASGNDLNNVGAGDFDSVNSGSVSTADGTVDGKDIVGYTNSSPGDLSFGDWEQVSASRPSRVALFGLAETDGSNNARITVEIDESGGTNADYTIVLVFADDALGSSGRSQSGREFTLPAGAQYRVVNDKDPNNGNSFIVERVFEC